MNLNCKYAAGIIEGRWIRDDHLSFFSLWGVNEKRVLTPVQ
jgi:hypothetical protein